MGEVGTIGLHIAKSVFQVHGVDVAGAVVIRKHVSRPKVLEYFGELPPCLIGSMRVRQPTTAAASPESLSRLFEPFYTTKPEGMGDARCIRNWCKAERLTRM